MPSLQAIQKLSLDFIETVRLQLDNKEFSKCGEGCPNRWCQISRDTGWTLSTLLLVFTDSTEKLELEEQAFETEKCLDKGKIVAAKLIFGIAEDTTLDRQGLELTGVQTDWEEGRTN